MVSKYNYWEAYVISLDQAKTTEFTNYITNGTSLTGYTIQNGPIRHFFSTMYGVF